MGVPQTPTNPPHLYPPELQLKLYQAFIFSIPILFSIILFLLFYLFYLKRRAYSLSSSPPQLLPRTSIPPPPYMSSPSSNLKVESFEKLPKVLFDEELRARDSQCCVCLGDFEIKEELLQIPYCKHVFHRECIQHWLLSNLTCPLCRCSIIVPATKLLNPPPPVPSETVLPEDSNMIISNQISLEQEQNEAISGSISTSISREHQVTIYQLESHQTTHD